MIQGLTALFNVAKTFIEFALPIPIPQAVRLLNELEPYKRLKAMYSIRDKIESGGLKGLCPEDNKPPYRQIVSGLIKNLGTRSSYCIEAALQTLETYLSHGGKITQNEKAEIKDETFSLINSRRRKTIRSIAYLLYEKLNGYNQLANCTTTEEENDPVTPLEPLIETAYGDSREEIRHKSTHALAMEINNLVEAIQGSLQHSEESPTLIRDRIDDLLPIEIQDQIHILLKRDRKSIHLTSKQKYEVGQALNIMDQLFEQRKKVLRQQLEGHSSLVEVNHLIKRDELYSDIIIQLNDRISEFNRELDEVQQNVRRLYDDLEKERIDNKELEKRNKELEERARRLEEKLDAIFTSMPNRKILEHFTDMPDKYEQYMRQYRETFTNRLFCKVASHSAKSIALLTISHFSSPACFLVDTAIETVDVLRN